MLMELANGKAEKRPEEASSTQFLWCDRVEKTLFVGDKAHVLDF